MEVGKVTATGLVLVIFFGAGERLTAWGLDAAGHDSSGIAAEAGPLGGTILYGSSRADTSRSASGSAWSYRPGAPIAAAR